ncbi:hypothetical protein D9M72_276030 [compost metagenome]
MIRDHLRRAKRDSQGERDLRAKTFAQFGRRDALLLKREELGFVAEDNDFLAVKVSCEPVTPLPFEGLGFIDKQCFKFRY